MQTASLPFDARIVEAMMYGSSTAASTHTLLHWMAEMEWGGVVRKLEGG